MARYLSNMYAPYGTCHRCGWAGKDWAFKYQGLCSKCYKRWRKERAQERRRLKPPNTNVEVSNGIVVTENVRKRLKRRAEHAVGPTPAYWLARIVPLSIGIGSIYLMRTVRDDTGSGIALTIIIFGGFFLAALFFSVFQCTWERQVKTKLTKLAEARKQDLEEQQRFYSSPEWRLLREQVIQEQGRICQECGRRITADFDLTVDHISPRSKHPNQVLDKSNLRVLCRSCNAKKGDTITVKRTNDDK